MEKEYISQEHQYYNEIYNKRYKKLDTWMKNKPLGIFFIIFSCLSAVIQYSTLAFVLGNAYDFKVNSHTFGITIIFSLLLGIYYIIYNNFSNAFLIKERINIFRPNLIWLFIYIIVITGHFIINESFSIFLCTFITNTFVLSILHGEINIFYPVLRIKYISAINKWIRLLLALLFNIVYIIVFWYLYSYELLL